MPSDKRLLELRREGYSFEAIAAEHNLSADSVRSRVSREARRAADVYNGRVPVEVKTTDAGGNELLAKINIQRLTGAPRWNRKRAIVTGDWHAPRTDWSMFDLMLRFAERYLADDEERNLLLVGDLFNFDKVSGYDHILTPDTIEEELAVGEGMIRRALEVFDTVEYWLGNHDLRLIKALGGELASSRLGRMIAESGKLRVSTYGYGFLESGGELWRLTHPRNYSRNKLVSVSALANKYQSNVIGFHEHHAAIGRDPYNRYTAVNGGGLFDYERFAYVQMIDNNSPVMNSGFVFVEEGAANLITPYPTLTNWRLWDVDATLAIGAAAAKEARLSGRAA